MKIKRVSDAIVRAYKLRMCHVSDTHGGFPRLHGRYDCVVHTGDFCPNSTCVDTGDKVGEAAAQLQWVADNISPIKQWLNGHDLLFVLGNHDFLDPDKFVALLAANGVRAINLMDRVTSYFGVNFYGFPYVPAIGGNMWNYEREAPEMQKEVDRMLEDLQKTKVDVICAHAPLVRTLDLSYSNQILGSSIIANMLDYKIDDDKRPSHYLHGHIHEAHGLTLRNGMLISNAAITYQIIEIL